MNIQCPNCYSTVEVDSTEVGTDKTCPSCQERFVIPEDESEPFGSASADDRSFPEEKNDSDPEEIRTANDRTDPSAGLKWFGSSFAFFHVVLLLFVSLNYESLIPLRDHQNGYMLPLMYQLIAGTGVVAGVLLFFKHKLGPLFFWISAIAELLTVLLFMVMSIRDFYILTFLISFMGVIYLFFGVLLVVTHSENWTHAAMSAFVGCGVGFLLLVVFVQQTSSGETHSTHVLRSVVKANQRFQQNDPDGNGVNDYWTADVYGLWAILLTAGQRAELIGSGTAGADYTYNSVTFTPVYKGSVDYWGTSPAGTAHPAPKSGYYFAAFKRDANGEPYGVRDEDGFAFMAFPEEYGVTGNRAFIVNQAGVMWEIDAVEGGFNKKTGEPTTGPGEVPVKQFPEDPSEAGYTKR